MKYKVGEKVRYDGGDWWFYGTVSAVFEHPICPCYRLSVERMEKKSCKFSITQFEYELEPFNSEVVIGDDQRKRENAELEYLKKYQQKQKREPKQESQPVKVETAPKKVETAKKKVETAKKKEPSTRKRGDAWMRNLESFRKGEKSNAIYTWITYNRRLYKSGKLDEGKLEKLMEINFPFDTDKKNKGKDGSKGEPKRKKGEAWDKNFESYRSGEKSNIISTWIAQNRKMHKTGKLPIDKYEKLIGINFPFDIVKKPDAWDKQLEEWKKDRKSIPMQQWRQRNIRQFLEGKLSADRIVKLKEVGILK